jgi:hypothetical protein
MVNTRLRPMLQNVSNFVIEGATLISELANLQNEVSPGFLNSRNNGARPGNNIHCNAKMISEDTAQFRQIQEILRNSGCATHSAILQVIPDIIESHYEFNTKHSDMNVEKQQCNNNRIKKNRFKNRRRLQEYPSKKRPVQNGVSFKIEKDGEFTWINRSKDNSKSNPIRRRSVTNVDMNCEKLFLKKTFGAQGA